MDRRYTQRWNCTQNQADRALRVADRESVRRRRKPRLPTQDQPDHDRKQHARSLKEARTWLIENTLNSMRSPIRVTSTRTQPIVVVQRAYQKFCALGETTSQTVYSPDALAHASWAYGFEFLFAKQQTVLATEPPVE